MSSVFPLQTTLVQPAAITRQSPGVLPATLQPSQQLPQMREGKAGRTMQTEGIHGNRQSPPAQKEHSQP